MPGSRPRPLLRALATLWLALSGLVIAGLVAELWLRVDRAGSLRASERFRSRNVFFAHTPQLNAASRTLWLKPWFKYRPRARAELVIGGEHFLVEINSRGFRTAEFALPKPPGLVRVACIGGSWVAPNGLVQAEDWATIRGNAEYCSSLRPMPPSSRPG